ncbi:Fructose-bisphosphate aldolase 1 [Mycoemilia scoparia]|uniref:Fructose-bisphosphate aldolase n=1 Tax=Mycoemilia scoparia TaxID=417184 RepID=A0A9W8DQV3_9FUNG|nr:Fructose-bisphosphate aldolase 1 [Mycoemilia scoparia]
MTVSSISSTAHSRHSELWSCILDEGALATEPVLSGLAVRYAFMETPELPLRAVFELDLLGTTPESIPECIAWHSLRLGPSCYSGGKQSYSRPIPIVKDRPGGQNTNKHLQADPILNVLDIVKPGVLTGDEVRKLFLYAQEKGFAIPAVNCTSSSTINAVLEAARDQKTPIIIQVSQGGSAFYAGKGLPNGNQEASILGAVAAAKHVREVAKAYGVPVVMHSDHCAKKLLPWMDGMIEADEAYFKEHGVPLFSSHMIDLSEETNEVNIGTTRKYFERLAKVNCFLEMEIGITGGEEDGVNNEDVDASKLYTTPEDVYQVYKSLSEVGPNFSIAAAFGNVHGVYKPGNVVLRPGLLKTYQDYVVEKENITNNKKPVFLVFHGGSGSTHEEIIEAVSYGVVKMNVDTDTQWAYLCGVRDFVQEKAGYLEAQVGNPEGQDKPNKKYYDPRVWVRCGEKTMSKRVSEANTSLGNVNTL